MRRFPKLECLSFIAGAAWPYRPPPRLPPRRFRKTKVLQPKEKNGFPLCLQESLPTWDYHFLPHGLLATPQDVADYRNQTILSAVQDEEEPLDAEELRARAGRLTELLEDALDLLDGFAVLVMDLSEMEFPNDLQRQYQRLRTARNVLVQEFHSLHPTEGPERHAIG